MINSVLKAIDVLEAFSPNEPRFSLTEISDRLGLPKSTTHNLLNTLLSRGYIEKTDDHRYALGTAAVALTQAVRVNVELRDRAAPLLRELADACRMSVYLGVIDGDYVLYIYAIESPHRLRARTAVGDHAHLHCTSVGKAILSAVPRAKVEGIVSRVGLPGFTDATITDLDSLCEELERARAVGYALDRAEHEMDLYCIGAPIFDERGRVIGSCSVSGIGPDIARDKLTDLSARLRFTAEEISRRMGYVPPRLSAVAAVPFDALSEEVTR